MTEIDPNNNINVSINGVSGSFKNTGYNLDKISFSHPSFTKVDAVIKELVKVEDLNSITKEERFCETLDEFKRQEAKLNELARTFGEGDFWFPRYLLRECDIDVVRWEDQDVIREIVNDRIRRGEKVIASINLNGDGPIDLARSQHNIDFLRSSKELKDLINLNVSQVYFDQIDPSPILSLKDLRVIHLYDCSLDEKTLEVFNNMPNLKVVFAKYCFIPRDYDKYYNGRFVNVRCHWK